MKVGRGRPSGRRFSVPGNRWVGCSVGHRPPSPACPVATTRRPPIVTVRSTPDGGSRPAGAGPRRGRRGGWGRRLRPPGGRAGGRGDGRGGRGHSTGRPRGFPHIVRATRTVVRRFSVRHRSEDTATGRPYRPPPFAGRLAWPLDHATTEQVLSLVGLREFDQGPELLLATLQSSAMFGKSRVERIQHLPPGATRRLGLLFLPGHRACPPWSVTEGPAARAAHGGRARTMTEQCGRSGRGSPAGVRIRAERVPGTAFGAGATVEVQARSAGGGGEEGRPRDATPPRTQFACSVIRSRKRS